MINMEARINSKKIQVHENGKRMMLSKKMMIGIDFDFVIQFIVYI